MATIPPSTALAAVPGPSGVTTSNRTPCFFGDCCTLASLKMLSCVVLNPLPWKWSWYTMNIYFRTSHLVTGKGVYPARDMQKLNGVIHLGSFPNSRMWSRR